MSLEIYKRPAERLLEAQGIEVVPAPCNFTVLVHPDDSLRLPWPSSESLDLWGMVFHEVVGMVFYWVMSDGLWVMSYGLTITNYGELITNYELKIANVTNGEWLIENPQPQRGEINSQGCSEAKPLVGNARLGFVLAAEMVAEAIPLPPKPGYV